jgi:hypothetical protein
LDVLNFSELPVEERKSPKGGDLLNFLLPEEVRVWHHRAEVKDRPNHVTGKLCRSG